jgi:cell wall-associated NlpC family hydrolase
MVAGSANQAKLGKRIKASEANPGDLLFFGNNQRVSHVGIVSYNDNKSLRMIHSSSTRGVIEEDIHASTYWKSRFLYARNVISELPSSGKAER